MSTPRGRASRRTSRLALGGLALGMLWLLGIGSLFAVLMGALAIVEIRDEPEQRGYPVAIAAVVAGLVGLGVSYTVFVRLSQSAA